LTRSPAHSESTAEDQALRARIEASLQRQGMMQHLGVKLVVAERGCVTLKMPYSDKVTQQQGGYHGGAMGALADIAGGYAALTVAPPDVEVTTVEYKINFLAAFEGGELHATGRVVRAGKRLIITTAEVQHCAPDGTRKDCAIMQQTIAPVPKTY
jgi:uncharacterized protein (TIGR00369 family)